MLLILNIWSKNIFLLNDKEGAEFYSKYLKKVIYIPDPINLVNSSSLNIREYHKIEKKNKVFLHIGALGKYKGSFDILKCAKELDNTFFKKNKILFVGKIGDELQREIHKFNENFKEQAIFYSKGFISETDFSAYIEQANFVLIANKNIESSSGIVNHCLIRNKNIIAPNNGYFKKALKKYPNKILYENPEEIHKSLILSETFKVGNKKNAYSFDNKAYLEQNSPEKFCKILFRNI